MIYTPWPNLEIVAQNRGIVDPYLPENIPLFRGEEAFEADVTGRARWSKPSPEPPLDAEFASVLLGSIEANAGLMSGLAHKLASQIEAAYAGPQKPVLIAILRAGVPITGLLSKLLERAWGEVVPVRAFSLFYGLGWDDVALEQIVAEFPDRPLLFVDGWTSGGNVAVELNRAHEAWKSAGKLDFTSGEKPKLAVLCDPRGKADFSALKADLFVPSACFTAPETLGFSRGFALGENELFGVYEFPHQHLKPEWVQRWLEVVDVEPAELPADFEGEIEATPPGIRIHVNEVVRALINRDPQEIWLTDDEAVAKSRLAPLLHLAGLRGVPVRFRHSEPARWGAIAAARMT
ncbi:hypothetical protein EON80_07215 [bacterium]|nr:MAG: hypothetical protein EON80_07215 [bacterium]